MTYDAYLPPGYDAAANANVRYPTLYMLHGGSGFVTEWVDYGLLENADALIRDGTVAPMIIVLPEGDQEYWVDHVIDKTTGAPVARTWVEVRPLQGGRRAGTRTDSSGTFSIAAAPASDYRVEISLPDGTRAVCDSACAQATARRCRSFSPRCWSAPATMRASRSSSTFPTASRKSSCAP